MFPCWDILCFISFALKWNLSRQAFFVRGKMPNPPELCFCYFWPPSLTSNSSLSFEARGLKVWNQPFGFFIFYLAAEKWGFYKADKPDQTTAIMLFLTPIFDLKYLMPQTKYQKNWSVDFVPLIWELFLPIFSFLASKLWEEIEVTDRQTFCINSSHIEKSKLSPHSACFAREG